MKRNTQDQRKQVKKNEIMNIAESYRDERGNIDLAKLRIEKPKVYAKISYYFGSIDGFMAEINNESAENLDSVKPSTIRNKLAFERLSYLRIDKERSFEELGTQYDKTRMYMSKLYRDLEENLNDADVGTTLSRPVVRNQLAFEMLVYLIDEKKMSFEEIASKYDVPADYVERLYNDWKKLFKMTMKEVAVV